jgi:NADH:ubiquinone oxidoreductase subunit 5 (subunit L)/multisubunit Na+/H+ antiporter MnhA subunit
VAEDVAHESNFQRLTRIGFAARGFLYILIAALVILTGRTEDLTGALKYVGHGLGRALLAVIAAGMAGYGLWRLSDAAFGMESGRHRWKAWAKRIGAATSGIIYCWLALKAVMVLLAKPPSGDEAQHHAAEALHLSGGELLLLGAGAVLVGAALVQIYKALRSTFLNNLDQDAARRMWIRWAGRVGYAARGVVFLTIGYLLVRAGMDRNPAEAGNLDNALDWMSGPVRSWVALGLLVFGVFSIIEAIYRPIRKPPVEQVKREVRNKVTA